MPIKLSELYNPIIGGMPYNGFLNVVRERYNLDGTFPFMVELCDTIDRFLFIKKGSKCIDEQIENITQLQADYPYMYLMDILNAYKNELNKSWNAMNIIYNPLENYSMVESGTDKNSGSDTLIMNKGTYNNTSRNFSHSRNNTDYKGTNSTSSSNNGGKDTTISAKGTYNNTTRNYSHSRNNTDYKGTNSTSSSNNGGKDTTISAKGTYTNRTLKNGGKDSEVTYKGTSQNTINNTYKTSYDSNSPILSEKNTSDISNHGKDKSDYYKNTSTSENIHNHGQDKDTTFYDSKNKTTIKNGGRDRNVEKITDKETYSNHNHGQDKETTFYDSKNKTTIKNGGRDRNVEKIIDKETYSNYNHGQDKNEQKYGHNISHNLKRSGNIGVTTSQQMLQSEYEVLKFNFVNRVIEIIDNEFLSFEWGD